MSVTITENSLFQQSLPLMNLSLSSIVLKPSARDTVSLIYTDILSLYISSFTYGICNDNTGIASSSRVILESLSSLSSSERILVHIWTHLFSKLLLISSMSSMPLLILPRSNSIQSLVVPSASVRAAASSCVCGGRTFCFTSCASSYALRLISSSTSRSRALVNAVRFFCSSFNTPSKVRPASSYISLVSFSSDTLPASAPSVVIRLIISSASGAAVLTMSSRSFCITIHAVCSLRLSFSSPESLESSFLSLESSALCCPAYS